MNNNELPLTKGVIAYIVDDQEQILLSQNVNYGTEDWTFPGGEIDDGESEEEAIRRELFEEFQISNNDIELIARAKKPLEYNFSERYRNRVASTRVKKHRGQSKVQFYFKFIGNKNSLVLNNKELRQYKWVKIRDLNNYLHFQNQYQETTKVLKEFNLA